MAEAGMSKLIGNEIVMFFQRQSVPTEKPDHGSRMMLALVPEGGIEPPTQRFSVACSTN